MVSVVFCFLGGRTFRSGKNSRAKRAPRTERSEARRRPCFHLKFQISNFKFEFQIVIFPATTPATRSIILKPNPPMTPETFRRIALSLPETTQGSHFSKADFRIAGKIFATLALEHQGFGVLLLTPDQQSGMIQDAPEIFSPVPGGWGDKGATRVRLAKVPADILAAALRVAWSRKAPKRLQGRS